MASVLVSCACAPDLVPASDRLFRLIEPQPLILFGPDFDAATYWRKYIEDRARDIDCRALSASQMARLAELRDFSFRIPLGETVSFADGKNSKYLSKGWSAAAPWGRWSEGDTSYMEFDISSSLGSELELLIDGHAFLTDRHPLQVIHVAVNDRPPTQLRYDRQSNESTHVILLPWKLLSESGLVSIVFQFEALTSPAEQGLFGDVRLFGLALYSVKLVERK